jgi:hypothetical protein
MTSPPVARDDGRGSVTGLVGARTPSSAAAARRRQLRSHKVKFTGCKLTQQFE